jgi:heptosyltransferase-2
LATQILVIQTAFVGDVLLTLPLIENIRKKYPNSEISVLCRVGLKSLLESTRTADHVFEADKSSRKSWKSVCEALKSQQWDFVFSPHQSFRTLLLVRSLTAHSKVGYRSLASYFIFDRSIKRNLLLPEVLRQLALLEDAPLKEVTARYEAQLAPLKQERFMGHQAPLLKEPLATIPPEAQMSLDFLLEIKQLWQKDKKLSAQLSTSVRDWLTQQWGQSLQPTTQLVLMAPGSVWPTKMWRSEGYAELARQLLERGFKVILTGSKNEINLCEEIARMAPGAEVAAGRFSLPESCELLALAGVLISNDSGAMHMAALSNTPTLSLFGPTVLKQGYRPWQNQARVLQADLECRPCGRHGSLKCPLGTHACMKNITAVDVLKELDNFLVL